MNTLLVLVIEIKMIFIQFFVLQFQCELDVSFLKESFLLQSS